MLVKTVLIALAGAAVVTEAALPLAHRSPRASLTRRQAKGKGNREAPDKKGTTCIGKGKEQVMIKDGSDKKDTTAVSLSYARKNCTKGGLVNPQSQEFAPIRVEGVSILSMPKGLSEYPNPGSKTKS